ncbi:translation initiation factor IF-2 [Sorangium sp. So ce1389]|uniref:translation initiation factor IF-2 n=1 Tax=Sorangium sp. So ce1389 TaxID=3133336 RepID=UPI003F639946
MTLARRLALGLGLVMVIAVVARVAWVARRSGTASTSAQQRSRPPTVPSGAPAPEPPPPRALERSASSIPSQAPSGRPPTQATSVRAPAPGPEDQAALEPPSPAREQEPLEPPLDEVPTKAATAPRRARRLEQSAFQRRLQPGLCTDPREAARARETLISRFRDEPWGDAARLYVDPRLPDDAHLPLLYHLEQAERAVFAQLKLEARRPDVFAYLDTELLVAAACTNRGVVAYYDGALHVVTTRSDIQASVLHEYTHHVLMSHGMLGPAWAQEGIAMHVARETWWLDPVRLEQVRDAPISLEVMEQAVPYTLRTEDAVLFYVQAASMVGCFARGDGARLRRLMDAMGTLEEAAPGGSSDELSQLLEPSTWQSCIDALMRDISPLR